MNRLLLAAMLIAAASVCGCRKELQGKGSFEEFVERSDTGLYSHGGFLFKYDKENCQVAINLSRKQIRMQSDDQTDYVNMQFTLMPKSSIPNTEVTIKYKVGNEEITSKCTMEIIQYKDDKFWLWDSKNHLGIITPSLWTGTK